MAYNKVIEQNPKQFSLLVGRAAVLKKLPRYEEANADYSQADLALSNRFIVSFVFSRELTSSRWPKRKARLQAAGKELSDEAIQAEIKLMRQEKKSAEVKASLRSSPLFQPICVLMQEQREWNGTAKQFKELLCGQFPDVLAKWYRAPHNFVDELKRITPSSCKKE